MPKFIILVVALILFTPSQGVAFMDIFKSKNTEFQCAFEEDNNPPLDLNSEAHKLYLQAKDFEASKQVLTKAERENISLMYLEAMEQGHWKAKAMMVPRYMDGIGIGRNSAIATRLAQELMKEGAPIGYFNFGLFEMKGWGIGKDEKEGMELIHKAAELGSKDAQYMLGEYYIYKRNDDVRGLRYHVCAMRQGHAKSASAIASFLKVVDKNYPMYAEYLLRGGGLGNMSDLSMLGQMFKADHPTTNKGFPKNPTVANFAQNKYDQLEKNPKLKFPNISKECPLPNHPTQGDGRQMESALKEACGGKWPDEAYPDLKDW